MFGIPIIRPTNCHEELNLPLIYTSKKKHNSIEYHRTREAVAAVTIRVTNQVRWKNKSCRHFDEVVTPRDKSYVYYVKL
jgi:hypothetical protein